MACRQPPPQQLALPLWGLQPAAPAPRPPPSPRRESLDERMARRATWCANHEVHVCPLCGELEPKQKRRKRKSSEEGIDLRALNHDNPREAKRLRLLAESYLKRGAEPAEVHAETGIRMNTLHQMRSRLREDGLIP